jgi:glucose-1-phosphatase
VKDSPVFIFDLGKVLVDFDWSIAAKKIAARSHSAPESFHQHLAASQLLWQYECGQLDRQKFFEIIRDEIKFQGELIEFSNYFADIFSEISLMTLLHAELRQRGFKTFIFSNTNDLAIEHVRKNYPFFANFDGYIFSYEVGAMKPQPQIYEAMEKMSGKSGADLIYIDDRPENIESGLARGWQAILHETPEKTRSVIASLL